MTRTTSPPIRLAAPIALALALLALPARAGAETGATLAVEVLGVRSDSGFIELAVYDSAESFLESGRQVAQATLSAANGVVSGEIDRLPAGRYAIAVFHDENANDEFDTNFIGLPLEGYGFSNHATVFLGPPDFDDAAFEIGPEGGRVVVQLSY